MPGHNATRPVRGKRLKEACKSRFIWLMPPRAGRNPWISLEKVSMSDRVTLAKGDIGEHQECVERMIQQA